MAKKKVISTTWHVTESHTIHKGSKADCPHCRWKKKKKKKLSCNKKTGGNANVNRGGRKRVYPPRKCAGCGADILQRNKSGLCLLCFNLNRKEEASKPKEPKRRCSVCDKPIARINRSGLCRKCWAESPRAKKSRSEAQAWVNSAVFNRNATPLSKDSKEGRG